jgi:hypothetical protein
VDVRFLKGRLRFVGATNSAPFPSAIVILRPPSATGSYLDYLDSPQWKAVCEAAMRRANGHCERETPGEPRHEGPLEVRHLHYQTLGYEFLEDLEVICPACRRALKREAARAPECGGPGSAASAAGKSGGVMPDPCSWSSWSLRIDWNVTPGDRHREKLEAFLAPVLRAVERLAQAFDGGRDVDVVGAMSDYLVRCDDVSSPAVDDLLVDLHVEAMTWADAGCVDAWTTVLDQVFADDAMIVAYVAVAVLLERVLRATLTARADAWPDPELLHSAVEALEAHVRWVLRHVLLGTVSPSLYRTM